MPRPVKIDDLFRLVLPSSPTLSPDGEHVVYVVKKIDKAENRYVSHLWIRPAKGRGGARQLTHGTVSDGSPAFSPDGKSVAFVSDRGEVSNVWLLPLQGGEPRQLTKLDGGGISSLSWSPNGQEIAFSFFSMPKVEEKERKKKATFKHVTSIYHKEDGLGWFRGEYWTIWKVSVSTGTTTALTKGDHHDHEPAFSPDGKQIAFASYHGDDRHDFPDLSAIYVMDHTGHRVRTITKGQGSRTSPRWSADGKSIYYIGYDGGPGEWLFHDFSIWNVPLVGGKARELNRGHDRWPFNGVGTDTALGGDVLVEVYQDGDEERVAFGSDEDGSFRVYSLSSKGGDVRREIGGEISVIGFSVGSGRKPQCVYAAATKRDLGEICVGALDGSGKTTALSSHTGAFFRPLSWNEPEEFRVKSGRYDLQCWVLRPPNFRKGKKYPCLIEVHGGPMTQYGEAWHHEMQTLAGKGWVVAYCNPRGSSGRGMKFCNVIEGDWGNLDWKDVQALTAHMAKQPYVDTARIGILGGSYGGYMTTWAVSHSKAYKAAVTQRQAGDFWVHFGASDYGHYRRFFFKKMPWDDPMAYHKQSPNFYVKRIKTPLLIIHSEGDLRCPIAESESLFTGMKVLNNAPCEMVRFEGEFHGLSRNGKPRNREERLKRIVDWFERYL